VERYSRPSASRARTRSMRTPCAGSGLGRGSTSSLSGAEGGGTATLAAAPGGAAAGAGAAAGCAAGEGDGPAFGDLPTAMGPHFYCTRAARRNPGRPPSACAVRCRQRNKAPMLNRRALSLICVLALIASCKPRRPDDELWEREDYNTTCTGIAPQGTPNGCGCFRWLVKTGTDTSNGAVNTTPVDTTIAALRARGGGVGPGSLQITTPRITSGTYQEVTTYKLTNVSLTGCRSESDADVHLILADANDASSQMDAEMPNTSGPDCVGDYGSGTPWKAQIAAARSTFF